MRMGPPGDPVWPPRGALVPGGGPRACESPPPPGCPHLEPSWAGSMSHVGKAPYEEEQDL